MSEEVYTDLDEVPFAVKLDPPQLSFNSDMLKGQKIRVRPSDEHEWTFHMVEKVERQDDGSLLARLSKPLA